MGSAWRSLNEKVVVENMVVWCSLYYFSVVACLKRVLCFRPQPPHPCPKSGKTCPSKWPAALGTLKFRVRKRIHRVQAVESFIYSTLTASALISSSNRHPSVTEKRRHHTHLQEISFAESSAPRVSLQSTGHSYGLTTNSFGFNSYSERSATAFAFATSSNTDSKLGTRDYEWNV